MYARGNATRVGFRERDVYLCVEVLKKGGLCIFNRVGWKGSVVMMMMTN
jgi:hypothetical protein